ncbi:aspartate/glutamate racemase family protein [Mangrovicoccus ximenensis]|uniref:aspartate/glutamate racemase family protein n=1 Tax=Mangrovicoccus ximenensis TaxID=1911570 RepID=UPI000D3DA2C4|nr:aspartate/glutamate racemase family protein [Mangrovicoccus ximenensis]
MRGPVLVVNPNSSPAVTQGIRDAIAHLSPVQGAGFEVTDLPESPATILTNEDVARAGLGVAALAQSRPDAAAFVIGCFSDPGLELARSLVPQPVIGCHAAACGSAACGPGAASGACRSRPWTMAPRAAAILANADRTFEIMRRHKDAVGPVGRIDRTGAIRSGRGISRQAASFGACRTPPRDNAATPVSGVQGTRRIRH